MSCAELVKLDGPLARFDQHFRAATHFWTLFALLQKPLNFALAEFSLPEEEPFTTSGYHQALTGEAASVQTRLEEIQKQQS